MHPWIKSALLPACSAYLINTPLQTLRRQARRLAIKKVSSEYFHEQIYTTFFNDPVGGHRLTWWGANNCMWPNDFPRGKSIGPNSFWTSARQAGHPYHATDSLLLKLGKTSDSQRPNLFLLFHHRRREHLLDLHQARGQPLLERILRRGLQHLAIGRDTVADERRCQRLARFGRE